MAIHLTYGGSTAHRTLNCPGWVKKSENLPKRQAGQAALEGSMLHEIMELCQRDGLEPSYCLGHVYKENNQELIFTDDHLPLAEIAFNATCRLMDAHDIETLELEPFVQYSKGKVGGSIDLLGLSYDKKTLLILDYKFGSVKVVAKESPNLGLYAFSARADKATADLFDKVEKIIFAIVQPRIRGVVNVWTTDLKWVDNFEETFTSLLNRIDLHPGKHCNYCPAEPFCEVKRLSIVSSNLLRTEDHSELKAAADLVEEVEAWVKRVKEELYLQMSRGVQIDGYKIVEKRKTRRWLDESVVEQKIKLAKKDMYKTTLLSPAQMEKVLKKKKVIFDLTEFVELKSSGTTIATEDDSREAVIASDVQGELKNLMN